ncbi:rhamnosyltransferase [Photorhabdus luminescens]|uniref:Rhamnosyltransferase n=1 Tax=Photorhabdus akhurstii TaxID=171438 RepID=A0ABX8LZR8_9GAMM|nr:glycosyltransferase [Photorhabdus akhurstii]QXF36027.1 rhamnosyltransferase [Photorhabdus akhurstii]UJD77867.1 rhamnosyltransferase [Photorhabdus luminescens]
MVRYGIIVPTYNAGVDWKHWLSITTKINNKKNIVVIDSSSSDSTVDTALQYGVKTISIPKSEFNHGGTRNNALKALSDIDVVVFLTQDAQLATEDEITKLLKCFIDKEVAAVYGRQIPHANANPLAKHARLFNYSDKSYIRSKTDIRKFGIKSAFMSNSFAAYRTSVFHELGGFPEHTILAEDMFLTAKMILSGYKVVYCSEAVVYHSHNYSPWEEFRRYFDIGVFHTCQSWIQQEFGDASDEGIKFVKSELNYLLKNAPLWIPRALLTTALKLIGYKLGKNYRRIPKSWCQRFSMYKSYWIQQSLAERGLQKNI